MPNASRSLRPVSFAAAIAFAASVGFAACAGRSCSQGSSGGAGSPAKNRRAVDAHLHIGPEDTERLASVMDEVGISWGLNLSGGWPKGGLEEQLAAAKRSGRLLVAANLPWFAARRFPEFPKLAGDLLQEAKALGARALKVEKSLGLRVVKYDGQLLAVDDPWLDPIWAKCGELGLPVVIHTADPKAFWLPVDDKNERIEELTAHPRWSNYGAPVPSFEDLLAALMRVVERHPNTKFVGVHFGNNSEDPFWVGQMLEKHPNFYVDLAARVPELGRHDAKKLHDLFTKYADRIVFGTDTGLGEEGFIMLGSFGKDPNKRSDVGPYFAGIWRWLETWDTGIPSMTPIQGRWTLNGIGLSEDVLAKIYRENAEKLFGPPPSLEPDPNVSVPSIRAAASSSTAR